ncbi:hypothetical protein [Longibacter sp.]|uniref:hypothetical protein n=1 Tax=Longibacter sp. TaxID=2045415 RepID=UPI003EBBFABF
MYIDYIILGVISLAVLIWAYSRLPEDDDNDSDGGQVVPVEPTDGDPEPPRSAPPSGDGAPHDPRESQPDPQVNPSETAAA